MKRPVFFILMWLCCLLPAGPALPQEVFFNKVLPPEGKRFVHITGMVQDRHGYMWFASKKGLFRYDGYQMIAYRNNPLDTTSLITDALEAICTDASGILWIASFSGLERFDPVTGIFTHFRHDPNNKASISSDLVSAVLVDREGTLWVGTSNGLDRFDPKNDRFLHYRHQPNDPASISSNAVVTIYEDRKGQLWIGTGSVYAGSEAEGGLNRLNKKTGTFTRYQHQPNNPHSLINNKVRAVFEDSRGTFWVGTGGDGLHTMDRTTGRFQRHRYDAAHPQKLSRPPFKKKPYFDHITFITEDAAGAIWIGTAESGINYYDRRTGKIRHYELEKDTAGAFTDRTAWWAYTSREGVLWISTLFGNLYRINPLRWNISYNESPAGQVKTFHEDEAGNLWLGTQNGLLVQRSSDKEIIQWYGHDPANSKTLSNNAVEVIEEDRQGNIWVGTQEGLNVLDKRTGTFTRYRSHPGNKNSLSNDYILCVYEDRKADVWIGTLKGLNCLNRRTGLFTRYVFHPEDTSTLGLNIVSSVRQDRQDLLWAGCWMVGDVHQLNPATGTYKTYLNGIGITCFYEDAAGTFWVGGDDGLFRYDPSAKTFVLYTDSSSRRALSYVRSMVEDERQHLWVGTRDGIFELDPQRRVTRIFGKGYGINGNNLCNGSCYKGEKKNKGTLFFGTYSGYYVFQPDGMAKDIPPPKVVLSGFRLANQLVLWDKDGPLTEPLFAAKKIELRYHQNNFSFDFAALDFTNPEDNRHLFMLENYDADWNEAGSDRKAVYYNVPPGRYVFRVKGANSYGVWAEKSIALVITPPWWGTWWFRIPAALAMLALLYGIIRWRMHQQFRRQLERSENERTNAELQQKATKLEMQALRAQMNPHFIFNSLNSINRFILQNNKAQASEYLTKFSRLVRLILQNSQEAFITLESELEALRLYLELEQVRFDQHFDYNIKIDDELDVSTIKVPPLIIQPYAENAIWHGLMHKKEKGNLEVALFQENNVLYCKITDDGIGRRHSAELKSKSASSHKSMGMRITADRIALLQQQKRTAPCIEVTDLVLPDGSAGGTEVLLKIPLHHD